MKRFSIVLALLFAPGVLQAATDSMANMPCHQMADGTSMGNCESIPTHPEATDSVADDIPPVQSSTILDVRDGDTVELTASVVQKEIAGVTVTMYAYNDMIPGVVLRAKQNSTFTVVFYNEIPEETTVHWHGLRHANKDDGVPGVTQPPVQPGESYRYTVKVPDAGIYWYHPHVREDRQQDKGLAGNLLVMPTDLSYWNPVHREELLVLDDILMGDKGIIPFGAVHATHAVMGRFGNVMLANGEESYDLTISRGEVVRFYITNVANTRPFNLTFPGARVKLVGSDLGAYEQEEYVDSIIIAPAERYIVELVYEKPGEYEILNVNPHQTYDLGTISVNDSTPEDSLAFEPPRQHNDVMADIDTFREHIGRRPDYTLELGMKMRMDMRMPKMHASEIEWEDEMGMMNAMHTSDMVSWVIRDRATGKENMDVILATKVGDVVAIRLVNPVESMHPMQHPIHLHGQRFLVTSVDGKAVENLVWKDTVLVRGGTTVDILVDVTNPGTWMMHCHIGEHLESGMMIGVEVAPQGSKIDNEDAA